MAGRASYAADVWRYDGERFEQIGGDGIRGSWNHPQAQWLEDIILVDGRPLVAMNGTYTDGRRDPPVWEFTDPTWKPVGDIPPDWESPAAWIFNKLFRHKGELYLGIGGMAAASSMWKLDAMGRWIKIGGDEAGSFPWINPEDKGFTLWIYTIEEFRGDLYIGLASSTREGMGQVWRLKP
jgi:hypothetical protein